MRIRPVRPNVSLPFVRFGVNDSDWKYIFGLSAPAYILPFLMNTRVLHVPVEVWTTLFTFMTSLLAFNVIRRRKRPYWMQHRLLAFWTRVRFRSVRRRRMLPLDPAITVQRGWIIPTQAEETGGNI